MWHYQWLLVNEHLPQIAGQQMVNDVLTRGNCFYRPPAGDAFMPIEFGAAAYRFGHSMVRPSYRANFTSGTGDSPNPAADPFFALVFDATEPDFSAPVSYDRDDLLGGYPAPRRYVGWQTFFDLGDGQVKNNKKIDTTISSVLFTLPVPAIAPHTQTSPTVLPQRNLLRQLTWGLPSGQQIARTMRAEALSTADLSDIAGVYRPFATSTPLWYYILAEAKALAGGLTLGPVGGRIVTETLIGLLRADPTSYLSACPRFQPFLGTDLELGPTPDTWPSGHVRGHGRLPLRCSSLGSFGRDAARAAEPLSMRPRACSSISLSKRPSTARHARPSDPAVLTALRIAERTSIQMGCTGRRTRRGSVALSRGCQRNQRRCILGCRARPDGRGRPPSRIPAEPQSR